MDTFSCLSEFILLLLVVVLLLMGECLLDGAFPPTTPPLIPGIPGDVDPEEDVCPLKLIAFFCCWCCCCCCCKLAVTEDKNCWAAAAAMRSENN